MLYSRVAGAVADRWHLLANLSEAVERFLDTQRDNINQSITEWSADEEAFLTHLLTAHDSIRQVHELSDRFRQLMNRSAPAGKSAAGLAKWCEDAENIPAYTGFRIGLE